MWSSVMIVLYADVGLRSVELIDALPASSPYPLQIDDMRSACTTSRLDAAHSLLSPVRVQIHVPDTSTSIYRRHAETLLGKKPHTPYLAARALPHRPLHLILLRSLSGLNGEVRVRAGGV